MSKSYQTSEIDTSRLAVPETVNVALAEIAEDMRDDGPARSRPNGLAR